MKSVLNWIKHDCFGLIIDIILVISYFVTKLKKLDLYTICLVLFVILSTIQHYERYCNYKDKE